jgi:hypothetical protein
LVLRKQEIFPLVRGDDAQQLARERAILELKKLLGRAKALFDED